MLRLLRRALPRDLSEILLLGANLVPLLGAAFLGWSILTILYYYFSEIALVGLLTWLKLLLVAVAGGDNRTVADKIVAALFDFFIFWFLFGLTLLTIYAIINHVCLPRDEAWKGGRYGEFLRTEGWTVLSTLTSHTTSFAANFVRRKEYLRVGHMEFFVRVLHRLIPTFFAPLLLAVILQKAGMPDALLALTAVVAVKTVVDLWGHRGAHVRSPEARVESPESAPPAAPGGRPRSE